MVTTRRTVHATPPSPEAAFTTPPKAPKRTPDSFDSQEHRNAFAYVMVVKNATAPHTYRAFLENAEARAAVPRAGPGHTSVLCLH